MLDSTDQVKRHFVCGVYAHLFIRCECPVRSVVAIIFWSFPGFPSFCLTKNDRKFEFVFLTIYADGTTPRGRIRCVPEFPYGEGDT
jgi:hypothetical protein